MGERFSVRQTINILALMVIGAIGLAACDQRDARQERAELLINSSLEQIANGGTLPDGLTTVAPGDRAISGELTEAYIPSAETRRARFAIGSLVAKPRNWRVVMARERAELRALRPEIETETPDPNAETPNWQIRRNRDLRELRQQRKLPEGPVIVVPDRPLPELNRLPDGTFKNLETLRESERIQLDAQARMVTALDKYGLSGQMSARDDGEIRLLVGRNYVRRNQFTGEEDDASMMMTIGDDRPCPENASEETLRNDPSLATNCVISDLEASGDFEYVEKDYVFDHQFARRPPASTLAVPNDPLWLLQWNLRDPGTGEGFSEGGAGFQGFWSDANTQGSRDVTIAFVDTGIDFSHPEFENSENILPGWDMVSDIRMANDGDGRDSDPNDPGDLCDPTDPLAEDSFHGTHVAGTLGAAATNNRSGIAGSAWNVSIVPVRALGKCGGLMSDINDSIRWAGGLIPAEGEDGEPVWNENAADIINLSIGLFRTCPTSLQDAINAVVDRGTIVVSAAGNAQLPAEFYSPASCDNVITVAASDARGHLTAYSNFGDQIDIMAPGGALDRDDDGDGRPDGILSTRRANDCFDPVTGDPVANCDYAYEQGTSMAAPHVSAGFALLMASDSTLSRQELLDRLLNNARPNTPDQCLVPCAAISNGTPSDRDASMCLQPCGTGLLDLSRLSGIED